MGTVIDKLNYLKDTKEIFKTKLNAIGQTQENETPLREYLNWSDNLANIAKEKTDIPYLEGYAIQNGNPTQSNPIPIVTNLGTYKKEKNLFNEDTMENIKDTLLNNFYRITGENYDSNSCWIKFTDEYNDNIVPISKDSSEAKVKLYYTFQWPIRREEYETSNDKIIDDTNIIFSAQKVPFKIYVSFENSEEKQEIFASSDSDEFNYEYGYEANFTIPKNDSIKGLIFKNAITGEIIEGIGLINVHMIKNIEKNIDLNGLELAACDNSDTLDGERDCLILHKQGGDDQGKNYFNKDNLNYNFSDFIKYHDPSWEDEDAFIYEINNNDTNTWQLTSLDNGIRIKCSETSTNNDLGIFYMLPDPRINNPEDWYSLFETHFGAKFHVVGDRKPSLWYGRPNLAHNKFFLHNRTINDIEEASGELNASIWAYVPEGCQEEIDNNYIVIGFGFSAGENATENDYIDYTNIRLANGMWDSYPRLDVYVPYNKEYPSFVEYDKNINKKILNGTEENWTCTESNTPGVYKIDLVEDENHPWHGQYYYEEYKEEIYDPETWEPTGETKTVINEERSYVKCSHFKDAHYKESENDEAGYCSFYGTGISFYTDEQTTLEEWKNWLSKNPITFYYVLNEEGKEEQTFSKGEQVFETLNTIWIDESKIFANDYINNVKEKLKWKDKYIDVQNLIYDYNAALQIFKKKMEFIDKETWGSLSNWLIWIDNMYRESKDNKNSIYKIHERAGKYLALKQRDDDHSPPTQTNPLKVNFLKYLPHDKLGTSSITWPSQWEYPEGSIVTFNANEGAYYGFFIDFNNAPTSDITINHGIGLWPIEYCVHFNYCFSLYLWDSKETVSVPVVPFKIIFTNLETSEEIEIYNSNGASWGDVYYSIPKYQNEYGVYYPSSYKFTFIRTDNNEPLPAIGFRFFEVKESKRAVIWDFPDYPLGLLRGGYENHDLSPNSWRDYSNFLEKDYDGNITYAKEIAEKTFDGTETTWSCTLTDAVGPNNEPIYEMKLEEDSNNPWLAPVFTYTDPDTQDTYNYSTDVWCTHFKHGTFQDACKKRKSHSYNIGDCLFDGTNFYFYTNLQTNLNDWKTWLNQNPITVYYGTADIVREEITDEDTLNRLEEKQNEYAKVRLQGYFAYEEDDD